MAAFSTSRARWDGRGPATPGGKTCGDRSAGSAAFAARGAHRGERLIRAIPVAEALGGQETGERYPSIAPCLACHSPGSDEAYPSASAAAIWLGRATLPGGGVVPSVAPHNGVPGGCI